MGGAYLWQGFEDVGSPGCRKTLEAWFGSSPVQFTWSVTQEGLLQQKLYGRDLKFPDKPWIASFSPGSTLL